MESEIRPRNLVGGEVANFGSLFRQTRRIGSWLREIDGDRSKWMGRIRVQPEQPIERHRHPDFFDRFSHGGLSRGFAEIDVAAGKGPLADLRHNTPTEQKHPALFDNQASGDQFRSGKIDVTANVANLEASAIGQNLTQSQRPAAESAEADMVGMLMLNMMIRYYRPVVLINHRI